MYEETRRWIAVTVPNVQLSFHAYATIYLSKTVGR